MAFFLIKNSTDLKHIIFSLPEDYPKPPLFTMTILYNNCGIKIHLYKANTKKNSAANGYSNLLPNGTGVISVIWTQTLQILKVRQKTVIINKSITDNKIFARDVREDEGETRIGDALKYIKKNEVHVIDIAKLSEDKQAYVFGDAIRTIYDLQLGQYAGEEGVNPPSRIVIFIDELNKYASKETPKNSPILRQVLDVAERGRSLGVVLFAAEQFRSAIHDRVTGNCSTHAYGRTNSIEVTKSDYKSIPSVYKTMMTRLKQGEYIIQNPIFRSLLNIKFPKPIYKQFK